MPCTLNKNDRELLTSIAEHRVLTTSQIRALHPRNERGMRRRLQDLEETGVVRASTREFGHARGRPEKLVSLTEEGVAVVRKERNFGAGVPEDQLDLAKLTCLEHQLLVNWFRIHMVHMTRVVQRLEVQFLSATSPFLDRTGDGRPLISDVVPRAETPSEMIGFTPDGVFSIRDKEQGKTLLFFLEADRGTETIVSPSGAPSDIRQKVINYQTYFGTEGYKRYEKTWKCTLNGFRLLFLTCSEARLVNLCRLVRETPPSDFIWLTDQSHMCEEGVSGDIWARGGKQDAPLHSIIGDKMTCRAPIPD